jgi:hypothetical protein
MIEDLICLERKKYARERQEERVREEREGEIV